jgi:hypothetical protein
MSQKSAIPSAWVERLAAFKRFATAAELAQAHPPAHKTRSGGTEIWHYPLGVTGGTLFAIHVAVADAGADAPAPMAYMHMEPTGAPDTVQTNRDFPFAILGLALIAASAAMAVLGTVRGFGPQGGEDPAAVNGGVGPAFHPALITCGAAGLLLVVVGMVRARRRGGRPAA